VIGVSPVESGLNQLAPLYIPFTPKTTNPEKHANIKGINSIVETIQLEILATLEKKPTNQM
jgi:hypothetical protein